MGVIDFCSHNRRHTHGTHLGYRCGCRCGECVKAARRWDKHRSVLGGLLNADATRNHLAHLIACGVSLQAISDASGVSIRTLKRIHAGQVSRVQAATQAAIMACPTPNRYVSYLVDASECRAKIKQFVDAGCPIVRLALVLDVATRVISTLLAGKTKMVDCQLAERVSELSWFDLKPPTGARRRLQALAVAGWPLSTIAEETGIELTRLARIQNGVVTNTTPDEFDAIHACAKRLARINPKPTCERSREQAGQAGWRSLAAFSNPDDPESTPSDRYSKPNLEETIEDLNELVNLGFGIAEATRRGLAVSETALERRLQRAGVTALLNRLRAKENRLAVAALA